VYPMRADWNQTMLQWMDQVLKGKNRGLADILGFESQGTDGNFRRSATWPPAPAANMSLAALDATCKTACKLTNITLLTAGNDSMRLAGSPVVRVSFQAQVEDPVLTAVLYKINATGRQWVGEGTIRGVYRNSLETPSPVVVGQTYSIAIALYPLDAVLQPGESWVLSLGASVTKGATVATNNARTAAAYPGDALYLLDGAVLEASILPASIGLIEQPERTPCFTC
jgi:hypothetical protein